LSHRNRSKFYALSAGVLGATLVGTAFSATPASAATSGVTSNSITIGVVRDITGPFAGDDPGEYAGLVASVDAQNAKGGVDGRKIKLVVEDDASSPSGNLSAVQSLVENKGAYAIVELADAAVGGASYLNSAGIPVVETPNSTQNATMGNFFDFQGAKVTNPASYTPMIGKAFHQLGATKVGSLGLAIAPPSQSGAIGAVAAAKDAGLKAGYLNTTVQVATTDWTPYVLGFKSTSTNGYYGILDALDMVGFLTATQQQGLKLHTLSVTIFDNNFLKQPANASLQGDVGLSFLQPTQLNTSATKTATAALKKYSGFTSFDINSQFGYGTGLLLLKGLQVAGQNPTRSSFIKNLRSVTSWNANGLAPEPINFSTTMKNPNVYGPDNCAWLMKISGQQFTLLSKTPVCGPTITPATSATTTTAG